MLKSKLSSSCDRKKMKSSSIIRIHIRSSNKIASVDDRTTNHSSKTDPVSSIDKRQQNPMQQSYSSSINKIYPSNQFLTQSSENVWSDRRALTQDHHRTLKKSNTKISPNKFVVISVVTFAILALILTAVLVGISMTSKPSTKTRPTSVPVLRWNGTGITVFGLPGSAGNASNQLNEPTDVVLVPPDLFYVVDHKNHRVQRFQIGSSIGITVAGEAFGSGGTSSNQLKTPTCVFVDSSGGIFVTDSGNHRVQYWRSGASNGTTVAGSATGIVGTTNSTFNEPVGIVRDEVTGTLYVADFGNNRVMGYLNNAISGSLAAGNGTFGTTFTELWKPAGLYLDTSSHSLVIANHNAHNIVRWKLGAHNWTLLAGNTIAVSGSNATMLYYPKYVTFDPMGNMYVVDARNHRIQLFMVGQMDGITIAGVSTVPGSSSNLLNGPYAARLDDQLNLYVADTSNHRIQKFLRY